MARFEATAVANCPGVVVITDALASALRSTRRRAYIGLRQVERERAALVGRAAQLNFATQEACQFTANREAQTGAAVLAARAGIRLLESLKDNALFLGRNSDTRVRDFERD